MMPLDRLELDTARTILVAERLVERQRARIEHAVQRLERANVACHAELSRMTALLDLLEVGHRRIARIRDMRGSL